MTITYHRIGSESLNLLADCADDVFDAAIQLDYARAFVADPRSILIVARSSDQVVGQIVAIVHHHLDAPSDLFIENLGVAQAWQRRGIARTLLSKALVTGADLGAVSAWVATEAENEPANALYRTFGARPEPFAMYSLSDQAFKNARIT
ncbi:MAG: GNAT family N-acetyltransferase [Asticcacaulis sp.]